MPFSHHSHSGQFCGHAKDTLEEVIQTAIAKGFHTFCLTEHIPRPVEDFYPEEADSHTEESLAKLFESYIIEATRLRDVYAGKINIMIGFESEWIRPSTNTTIQKILQTHTFDFFMGSLHHVHTIPIDFDRATYERARDRAGGTDERLFEDYFDAQLEMLQTLRPPIVGHFDLIRLLSDHRDSEFKGMEGVWKKMRRNLDFIAEYGGILELNSSGLRKGMNEPYPCLAVCQYFLTRTGTFALSDDSHGTDHIGTNYDKLLSFIRKAGITELYYLDRNASATSGRDTRFPGAGFTRIGVEDVVGMGYWTKNHDS